MSRLLAWVRVSAFALACLTLALPVYGQGSGQRGQKGFRLNQGGAQGGQQCQHGMGGGGNPGFANPLNGGGGNLGFANPLNGGGGNLGFANPLASGGGGFGQGMQMQNPFSQLSSLQNGQMGGFQNGMGMMQNLSPQDLMQLMQIQQAMMQQGFGGQQNMMQNPFLQARMMGLQGNTGVQGNSTSGYRGASTRRR